MSDWFSKSGHGTLEISYNHAKSAKLLFCMHLCDIELFLNIGSEICITQCRNLPKLHKICFTVETGDEGV